MPFFNLLKVIFNIKSKGEKTEHKKTLTLL